ncbi:MAG: hypothetical protein R3A48_11810 [Polyangiales bacterium]
MAKTRPAAPVDPRWGHRLPAPLPKLKVVDPFCARVQTYLRKGGGDAEVRRALEDPSPEVRALLLRYLAMPESADVGAAPWDPLTHDALDPALRRLYKKSLRAVERARGPRVWGLFYAVRALAPFADGRALALARFREGSDDARLHIARAWVEAPAHLTERELDALATMLDGPATPETLPSLKTGAWAAYRREPSVAFERLSPRLAPAAIDSAEGAQRAIAVLVTLRGETSLDPRWGEVIRPLLRHRALGGFAVWALDPSPLDRSWVDDLLAYLHLEPGFVNVWDLQALTLLTRVPDPRASAVFREALATNSSAQQLVLTFFEAVPDEGLRADLAAWAERHAREGAPPDWPPLARARALLAQGDRIEA